MAISDSLSNWFQDLLQTFGYALEILTRDPLLFLITLFATFLTAFFQLRISRARSSSGLDFQSRVDRLSAALREANLLVSELDTEISKRTKRLDRLQKEKEKIEALKDLSDEELGAIADVVHAGAKREGVKAVIFSFLFSALFFTLGIFIGQGQ